MRHLGDQKPLDPLAQPLIAGTSKNNRNEVRSGRDGGNSANKMSILRKMDVDFPNGRMLTTPHLTIFTLSQLSSATSNFGPDAIIGRGDAFGTVFMGWLDEKTLAPAKPGSGMVTAIKKLNPGSWRMQGIQEWQSEIDFLGRLSHPNVVKLLGYCLDKKEVLLVYEFMAKGSLEQHLFKKVSQPLSWSKRLKILIGAARGLAFLHTSHKRVIYRDFKASNILLDSKYHAKLSDYGLAKVGPPTKSEVRKKPEPKSEGRVMGTYRYPPPEDVATGDFFGKSDDVYGFGVVLLETLTGLRAFDTSRPSGKQNLVEWSRPLLSDEQKLKGVMDKRLEGRYPPDAALEAARLSLKCLRNDPRRRPSMKEVVDALEQIEAIKQKPRAAAPPAKPKTTAPPAKLRAAKPKTTTPPAKPKTAAPPAKPKTAAPPAKPMAGKPKTTAPPSKPPAKPRAGKR